MAKSKKEEQAAPEQTEKKGLEKPNFRENLLGDRAGVNVNFNEEANIYEVKVEPFHRNEEKSIVYNKYGKAEVGPRMYKTAEGEYTLDKEKALIAPEPAPESKRGRGGR